MARYGYNCVQHGETEVNVPIGTAPPVMPCETCGRTSERIFTVPHFTEDRSRFWRGKDGTRYSSALGCELPDSRREIERLARAKHVELDAHELPHVKRAAEAGAAIRAGELRDGKEVYRHIAEPRPDPVPLVETLRKSGKMRAVAERIAVGYENWSDRGKDSAAEMARKGAEALAAGPSVLRPPEKAVPL